MTTVKLEDLLVNNEMVFVDIMADWCATCQFNKLNVINSSIIQETFEKYNIIKPNMRVVDLGAAPGGWCQILTQHIDTTKPGNEVFTVSKFLIFIFIPVINDRITDDIQIL